MSYDETVTCDIAIIGSGMGGGTAAWALRNTGAHVVLVDRGDHLPAEPENWSARAVFVDKRYKNAEPWIDQSTDQPFTPGVHYYVGGNTKVYGACLPRFRKEDFDATDHFDGPSPAWPVSYADMEPFYGQAEGLYRVHGAADSGDPTEPFHSGEYPYPPLEHEPDIQHLADQLTRQGLHPFSMPMGVDRRPGGRCLRCATCDGYPCRVDAKSDADVTAIRPAVADGVQLLTRTLVTHLQTSGDGRRVTAAIAERDGTRVRILAHRYVLAAGAANTAALLLRSGGPVGLANRSGLVGRRYMVHNSTFLVAVDPRRRNQTRFQKTLGINDWYLPGGHTDTPLGNLQMLGKLHADSVRAARPWAPTLALDFMTGHSIDIYLTTEDLPSSDNRIVLRPDGQIGVHWSPNNLRPHRQLVRKVTTAVRRAGHPMVFTERMGIETNSHQCGTAVMGHDPAHSVVDPHGRTHDLNNLWICDSSVFPSSAALNPALTIAANAIRVAQTGGLAA